MERSLKSRRLSRFHRKHTKEMSPRDLQRVTLTKRDKDVLLSVYHHRCLTTEQITEIHFKFRECDLVKENSQAQIVTRRRLRKLFDYQLIDRFFVDVRENNGSSQAHIVLDRLGARIVAGLLNCPVEELYWRYEMNEARLPYLQHIIEVNDFFLQLLRMARRMGHEVGRYLTENLTRYEFRYNGARVVLNPDAYGTYFTDDSGFHFFHERDRGTMTLSTFQRKQRRYAAFYESEEYRKYFETFPLVLTVTPTWERAIALRDCIYEVDNTDIRWFFTSDDLVKANPLGSIWLGKANSPIGLL